MNIDFWKENQDGINLIDDAQSPYSSKNMFDQLGPKLFNTSVSNKN